MNGMAEIIRDGNAWIIKPAYLPTGMTDTSVSVVGLSIEIHGDNGDTIFLTADEANALLSILPEAIAALKQNSA
jgi:hypothetical protein